MTPLEWALLVALIASVGGASFLAAALRRSERGRTRALAARASAVESQQRVAELAVSAERLRILREMHDVIAHSLAIMIAQADGGSYVATDADAAKRTFVTIAETGRSALADTRRILGILKDDNADPALAPDLDTGLDELAATSREAGLSVSLVRVGEPRQLPGAVRTALHRIAQESLTNVLKHAGEGAAVVMAENWRPDEVALTITSTGGNRAAATDPVTGESLAGTGLGLIGMRERAEMLGGTLAAGHIEGGFQVVAALPFRLEEES